jgi:hypothetical protein
LVRSCLAGWALSVRSLQSVRPRGRARLVRRPAATYASSMFLLILLVVIVAAIVAYKFRVPLLARILGQPESRVQRSIERRKR